MSRAFDFVELAFFTNSRCDGVTSARYNERTRDEFVALVFFDIVLLTGDEGLINFYDTLLDFTIDEDLVAKRIDEKIAFDDLVLINLNGFAISYYCGFLLGNQTHLVDGFFGADFIDDTDKGVCDSDENKKKVFEGADHQNHEC